MAALGNRGWKWDSARVVLYGNKVQIKKAPLRSSHSQAGLGSGLQSLFILRLITVAEQYY
jgi:hypothetical protein